MIRYSVIIPIYNSEKTLARCLDSLLRENRQDVQIIAVNDGSTDGSGEILRQYAEQYPCITAVTQENGGVSRARNRALQAAQGAYILFVDSDDYVSENYFSVLSQAVTGREPDLLLFGAESFGGQPGRWNTGTFYADTEQSIATRIAAAMERYQFSSLCNKCFKRTLVEGQQFDAALEIGEDQTFIFTYAMKISTLASISETLYLVDLSDEDSLSRKSRPYLMEQLMLGAEQMTEACAEAGHGPEARAFYERALSWMFYRSAYSCIREQQKLQTDGRIRRQKLREICSAYEQKKVRPRGWKCKVIAMPIRLHLAGLLDWLARHR